MKLSIIIPVYNEKDTIGKILEKVKKVALVKEIIVVDDGSTDGTNEFLAGINESMIKVLFHSKNQGKGTAIRTALPYITGEVVVIQDADLEYDPEDYSQLVKFIIENKADVVYGSRFLGPHRVFMFWHYLGNRFLTLLTNLLYDTILTDMETGYKAFRTDIFENITIKSCRFDFEAEITAKVFKKHYRVYEIPISYFGRDYTEGKKIKWKDGISAIFALIKYRLMD